MSTTTFLLNRPIPQDSVALGRLVLDPKYPDHDFCQPQVSLNDTDNPDPSSLSFTPDIATQRLDDFHEILKRTRGTSLELALLNLLSIAPSAPQESATSVTAAYCITHQLRNAKAYFNSACKQENVRTWLESELRRPWSTIYMICGLKTLADARVELSNRRGIDVSVAAAVDASLAATAAGVPLVFPSGSSLSVGGSLTMTRERDETAGYTAPGEQVFAVQYRKIRFSWFSTQKVDKAYLDKENRWKSYITSRAGGTGDESDDGVEAEVANSLVPLDLTEPYESVHVDGEEIIFRT